MMTAAQTIQDFLDTKLKDDLLKSYETSKRKASGNWGRTLEPFLEEKDGRIRFGYKGEHYSRYMRNGRGKNVDQSEEGILRFAKWAGATFIKQWVEDKGLDLNPFAVAMKIAEKGYSDTAYKANERILDFITPDYFNDLTKKIIGSKINDLRSDIIKQYER